MIYDTWNFDIEMLTNQLNVTKNIVIANLIKEGVIKGDYADICSRYVIIVKKKNMFGKWWDAFMKKENVDYNILLVKIIEDPPKGEQEQINET